MVSRIRIGPEGGPYVIVDENNGVLDITTPNDEIDFGNNELVNAALGGVLDAKGNDITNVDALDSNSLNTGKAIIGGQKADLQYQHIETIVVSGTSTEHEFSTSIGSDEILKFKYHLILDGAGTIAFRLNQDGDSTGNYVWVGKDGTVNGGANEFVIVENSSAAENSSGEITIQNAGRAITHNGGSRDNIVELSQGGGADAGSEISHIEFIAIGASFSTSGPSSSVELMRREIL